jgi:hypothetical protein
MEAKDLAKAVAEWGQISLEDLEDMREDLLDHLSELELEATPTFSHYTFEKLALIIGNIIKNPTEEKFKTLKMDN